eukprot:2187715-Amphidinium_carterae.2
MSDTNTSSRPSFSLLGRLAINKIGNCGRSYNKVYLYVKPAKLAGSLNHTAIAYSCSHNCVASVHM